MKERIIFSKENQNRLVPLATVGLFIIAGFGAFSKGVRKEIGRRDKWTCQECGKQFKDGWMVHAAHNSDRHQKSHPLYNDKSSGKILCIDCHQDQHELGTSLGYQKDQRAVILLKNTDRKTRK